MDKDRPNKLEKEMAVIAGNSSTTAEKSDLQASELYFTNRVYIDIIRTIKNNIAALPESDNNKQNLIRRSEALFKKAEDFFYSGLFVSTEFNTRTFKIKVYDLLNDLQKLAEDLKLTETAEELYEIIYNEACNEIVNNLMARTGRESSAGVLAIHFGLVDNEEALHILECLELKPEAFSRAVNAAWHDITEIEASLNFKGDIKKIFFRNIDIASTQTIN